METKRNLSQYLVDLLTEKGLMSSTEQEMKIDGHFGLTFGNQIDFICSAPNEIMSQIRNTFVKIDFKNGDVNHYWNYLTEGMLKSQGYEVKINE